MFQYEESNSTHNPVSLTGNLCQNQSTRTITRQTEHAQFIMQPNNQSVQVEGTYSRTSSSTGRHRNGNSQAPTLAQLQTASSIDRATVRSRTRVQAGVADGSRQESRSSPRSRLIPLAPNGLTTKQTTDATAPTKPVGVASQIFSVFTNPLSSAAGAESAIGASSTRHNRSRAAANIAACAQSDGPQQNCTQQQLEHQVSAAVLDATTANPQKLTSAKGTHPDHDLQKAGEAAQSTNGCSQEKLSRQQQQQQHDALHQTCRFAVHADGSEQLIDYNGYDQHQSDVGCLHTPPADSIQRYVYDEDTGQLVRMGEGSEKTRLGRHYLEDCHTGEFLQLVHQPTSGCWAWLRRHPSAAAEGSFSGGGLNRLVRQQQQQQEQEQEQDPSAMTSLSGFLDTMSSALAALGLFAQGLAGGLALLCLFMTYIQYAVAGRDGFLAFYSPQAEMINRTFFTLISISLVAAASRRAYDKLGHFKPRRLRLGIVDGLVMLLYFLAYTCNLLATPLDDQLAFEARRDPMFYTLQLPALFEQRLGVWHALNLMRVVACGAAWVLVCYRSNHFVMLQVLEARQSELHQSVLQCQSGASPAQQQASTTPVVASADAMGAPETQRRLQRMGSNLGSFVDRTHAASTGAAEGSIQRQEQWATFSRGFESG